MNKSKFLKKSLAVLLAVLMATAMIPLSAAAANLPDLDMLYVTPTAPTAGTQTAVEIKDGKFAADIPSGTTNVTIAVNPTFLKGDDLSAADVYAMEVVHPDSVTTTSFLNEKVTALDLTTKAKNEGGKYIVTLRLYKADDAAKADAKEYTLELTPTTKNTTALLDTDKTEPVANTGVYKITPDVVNCVLTVQVARSATQPRVKLVAKDGAKIAASGTDGVSHATGSSDNNTEITILASKTSADGKHFVITSESTQNTSEWDVVVEVVDSLKTFSLGGYEGVFSDENSVGYDDTVTVTLPRSELVDRMGNAKTDVRLPVAFSVNGNVTKILMDDHGKTSANAKTVDTTGTNNPYYFGNTLDPATDMWTGSSHSGVLFVPCGKNESGTQEYQNYDLIITVEKESDTEITYVSVDDIPATINGNKITAVLPNTSTLANTTVSIITVPTVAGVELENHDGSNNAGTSTWTGTVSGDTKTWAPAANHVVDLDGKEKIITVTAANGAKKNYILSATKSTNDHEAVMTDLTLGSGANAKKGVYDKATKTFTFTLPYMTLQDDFDDLPIYATVNVDAYAYIGTSKQPDNSVTTGATIHNGYTKADQLGIILNAAGNRTAELASGTVIRVQNKNNAEKWEDYNVKVVLEAPNTNRPTLTSMTISAQKDSPLASGVKNYKVYDRINKDNTFTAKPSEVSNLTGKLVFEPAFSLSSSVTDWGGLNDIVYNVITDIQMTNKGTAFIFLSGNGGNAGITAAMQHQNIWEDPVNLTAAGVSRPGPVSVLKDNNDDFNASGFMDYFHLASADAWSIKVLVAPEEYARALLETWDPTSTALQNGDNVTLADSSTMTLQEIIDECMVYTLNDKPKAASNQAVLSNVKVKDQTLTVGSNKITGTIPYSSTIANVANPAYNTAGVADGAQFIDFNVSSYAALNMNGDINTFNPKGDRDGDGYTDTTADAVAAVNSQLLFVRQADHKVKVYLYDATKSDGTALTEVDATHPLVVRAENRLDSTNDETSSAFTFDLKWADPNTESKITAFSIGGNSGAIVDSTETTGTITVHVPFKTDLKSLIPTFTTSSGATVTLKNGNSLTSGNVTLDFSNPVVVTVLSEDQNSHRDYTITVIEGEQFTDVPEGAWYHDEVMEAANLGWVSGVGGGRFNPNGNMKRGDFAVLISKVMADDFDADKYTADPFTDVSIDSYYGKAIAFCRDKGYISGFNDGTFKPENTITREQAAIVMCAAAGLETIPGNTNFADDATIGGWAKGAINACQRAGIYSGVENNNFAPKRTVTRAQGAALVVRAFSK